MVSVLVASLLALCVTNAFAFRAKVHQRDVTDAKIMQVEDVQTSAHAEWWGKPSCSEIIQGGQSRSWWRAWGDNCQCPYHWVIAGSDPACVGKKGHRHFSKDLKRNVCTCEHPSGPKDFVDIAYQEPKITPDCAEEYGFGDHDAHKGLGLPDFLDSAHSWCNSNLVPEDKRVPAEMGGLYWMKDLKLDDVAFCPSLGEWDEDTLTLKMSVWNMFVFGKKSEEVVSHLAETAASIPVLGRQLVYSIIFTNSSLTEADIKTNIGVANMLVSFPMWDIEETPDKTIKKEKKGDIFHRVSSIAGFETGTYFPVRIMDDDGTKHLDRYEFMKQSEAPKGTTFQRFKTVC